MSAHALKCTCCVKANRQICAKSVLDRHVAKGALGA